MRPQDVLETTLDNALDKTLNNALNNALDLEPETAARSVGRESSRHPHHGQQRVANPARVAWQSYHR